MDKLDELMNSESPDRSEVMSLQKEISGLKAQLQEKNLDYALEVKKIAPDSTTRRGGYGPGRMRGGYGKGQGRGPGYCWR
jgi:zinc resistance-associated protein